MAKQKLDAEVRKNILKARKWIAEIDEKDANEAETRQRVERMFETCMGYDVLKYITREYAIHGVGDTEHCDLAIQLDVKTPPVVLIEIKRVKAALSTKHLKQVTSYAINKGCEWTLLTNGKEWRLYHISFDQPPQTTLVDSWNIFNDDLVSLAEKFNQVCYKSLKRDSLKQIWIKSNVLTAHNILKIILSENSISLIRRSLRRTKQGITVSPEEVVGAVKRLLNETALAELDNIKISLGSKKQKKPASPKRSIEETKQGGLTNGQ
jgi:predicted type IV restriction endonuclease